LENAKKGIEAAHVGTMMRNGLRTVVNVDSDFDKVSAIRRVVPTAF